MNPITLLPENLVNRIAAGEVVERPASVVKELIENSIDAGSKEISVQVEKNGISLIQISDDGTGIPFDELGLAVQRHSTSKLIEEKDLFCIKTLGFRGEALPSIASVSYLEVLSRTKYAQTGSRLVVKGGISNLPVVAGCSVGTTVSVRDLFFNVPVRRKFLKSPTTELGHIIDVVNRMGISFGDINFRLYHNDKLLCDYIAVPCLEDRLAQVLGSDMANGMIAFSSNSGKMKISGFLSKAPTSFSTSRYLMVYVNRRYIRDRVLTHALIEGYETLLMKGRFPAAVLFLEIPPEEIDVNVHPAKHEIRFRSQSEIHDVLRNSVRDVLKRAARDPLHKSFDGIENSKFTIYDQSKLINSADSSSVRDPINFNNIQLSNNVTESKESGFFSSLEILGQIFGCYIVCCSPRGIALIDQHAAHERVAFEIMRYQYGCGEVQKQILLLPQIFDLPKSESVILVRSLNNLQQVGFTVENFGSNTYAITTVPALLPSGDYREILKRIVAEFLVMDQSSELQHNIEERLMSIACHSVIRANRKLEKEEIVSLMADLDKIDFATQCPHGRPVLVEILESQMERMFKRV